MKGPQNSHADVVLIEARQLGRVDLQTQAALLAPTDFSLHAGERLALIGASGSGKSVLLRALALLDAPSSGEVLWLGEPITAPRIPHFRSRACYLTQRAALVEGSVMDNVRLPFTLKHNRQYRFDADTATRLLALAGKPSGFLDKTGTDLSGGEAQLVALVRALLLAPQVLLLDEPTSALDPQSVAAVEALVMNWLDESPSSRAFLWITHDHAQAERISTRTLTMHHGVLQK
ncbi:ABC transporter ATP-binding protein [Pseudomonas putida]|uniref:ABC transporter ATP-binding protein n=1 Tax=Pseudomonas putida TaxID=303 RepID=A0A2S3X4V8_PSEPU|nr:ATP-binding cassette domain-containing protein [Pseudomonas putida]POG10606.1 ABC transporter ATP-binding protein [Pseudomonas putida]POG16749.1 ABC transporter ATP-binding protein [Pseudomonas putida]